MKTTAPKLPTTRQTHVGRKPSRFAPYNELLLELFKKYPSNSGRGISFRHAFKAEPGLRKQLSGEGLTSLRDHSQELIRQHLLTNGIKSTGFAASPALVEAATNGSTRGHRKASKFAVYDSLLLELFKRFPTASGKCVSFEAAFKADPSLRETLGIKTIQDMHSCEQHARKLLGTGSRRKYQRRVKAENLEVIPLAAPEPPPTANYCWNCGAPHRQVNQALALMAKLRVR